MDPLLISKTGKRKGNIVIQGGRDAIGFYTEVVFDGQLMQRFRNPYASESERFAFNYAEAMAKCKHCKIAVGRGVTPVTSQK